MPTHEQVMEALRTCYDPELPVNIVDLGLIYEVGIEDDVVNVKMTLTASGCPAHVFISQMVRERLQALPGVEQANVRVVWDPPWNPNMMSDAARRQLGII